MVYLDNIASITYLFKNCPATVTQIDEEAAWIIENIEICRKSQNLFKLKIMQNEIIN